MRKSLMCFVGPLCAHITLGNLEAGLVESKKWNPSPDPGYAQAQQRQDWSVMPPLPGGLPSCTADCIWAYIDREKLLERRP
jgi:hypothetical protein